MNKSTVKLKLDKHCKMCTCEHNKRTKQASRCASGRTLVNGAAQITGYEVRVTDWRRCAEATWWQFQVRQVRVIGAWSGHTLVQVKKAVSQRPQGNFQLVKGFAKTSKCPRFWQPGTWRGSRKCKTNGNLTGAHYSSKWLDLYNAYIILSSQAVKCMTSGKQRGININGDWNDLTYWFT